MKKKTTKIIEKFCLYIDNAVLGMHNKIMKVETNP